MTRKLLVMTTILVVQVSTAKSLDTSIPQRDFSAAEIVSRNIAARGGLSAWRAVRTLSMEGTMGAGGNRRETLSGSLPPDQIQKLPITKRSIDEPQLPFKMELARPRKAHIELTFNGKTAIQVYDGDNGWMIRPYLNRMDTEPFTSDQLTAAAMQSDLDGYLVDYEAKGTKIELEGSEKVEDRANYKLRLTLMNGQSFHIWIDAQTFLETKLESHPRRLDGKDHPVEVYYRDYRSIDGLLMPLLLETRVLPIETADPRFRSATPPAEKITIDKVLINPRLDPNDFARPTLTAANWQR